jgi:hypothetical protein
MVAEVASTAADSSTVANAVADIVSNTAFVVAAYTATTNKRHKAQVPQLSKLVRVKVATALLQLELQVIVQQQALQGLLYRI